MKNKFITLLSIFLILLLVSACGSNLPDDEDKLILGKWEIYGVQSDGEDMTYVNGDNSSIMFDDDGTGELYISGETNYFTWGYFKYYESMYVYKINLSGSSILVSIIDDSSSVLYGDLMLSLDEVTAVYSR